MNTYAGLAYVVSGHTCARYGRWRTPWPAPWGWRWCRVEDCDAGQLMPLWLYWLVEVVWFNRYHWTLGRLHRWGLWELAGKGHIVTEGRLTAPRWLRAFIWCFLNDRDHMPRPRFSDRPIYQAPFYGRTPRQYEAEKEYIYGVGWRHENDPITDADWRRLGYL